jgi:multiple sugar transport system permease protein
MTAVETSPPREPTQGVQGRPGRLRPGRRAGRIREALTAYVFVTPNLILLTLFLFIPLGWAVLLSFQDAKSFGTSTWIGLENYRTLFNDDLFWQVLVNSIVFTAATVPTSVAIGLVLAVLLNKAMPARGLLRTVIYLPIVISGLVTSLIGLLLFDEGVGIIDGVLRKFGADPIPWQTDGTLAMISIVLMTLWTRVGFAMVIYLAGLQDIDENLYEAARLDGASGVQQFLRITVPMLRPATLFLIVMNVIWSFQVFDVVYVMTGGGPGNDTSMLVLYAYNTGFGPSRDYGYGSTLGVVLFVLTLAFTAIQLRARRKDA